MTGIQCTFWIMLYVMISMWGAHQMATHAEVMTYLQTHCELGGKK